MSKKARRRYTAEFKAEAVALVERQGYRYALGNTDGTVIQGHRAQAQ
ncbi:hypothetical protein [Ectothiorhodospira sp. BSL-9]|nr:hypothetical protein [Ectothiorhodospira sp. BSL-9]